MPSRLNRSNDQKTTMSNCFLTRSQHHSLELNPVLLAAAGNYVAVFRDNGPSLSFAELPKLDKLVGCVQFGVIFALR
jgi:hypothetical protein